MRITIYSTRATQNYMIFLYRVFIFVQIIVVICLCRFITGCKKCYGKIWYIIIV